MYITSGCSRLELIRGYRFLALALLLSLAGAAYADSKGNTGSKTNPSYTQVGHSISIGPQEQVGDLTCFGCSVRVRGQVAGDVTVFGGNVVIEDQAQVAGDVTVFGGDIRLDQAVKVSGDATVFGGQIRRDPQSSIAGDVTSMGGHGWLVPILLSPLIILGLLIAFVVWLIQRFSKPSMPAAAA